MFVLVAMATEFAYPSQIELDWSHRLSIFRELAHRGAAPVSGNRIEDMRVRSRIPAT